MKSFLIKIVKFIPFVLIIYLFLLIIAGSLLPKAFRSNLPYNLGGSGYSYTRFHEADTTKNIDLLILGSSHAYRGYDTRLFNSAGFKTFNLGSSAQTPIQTEYILNRYLDQLHPKYVIVDVYPNLFNSDGVESTADLISNMKIDNELIKLSLKETNIKIYNTLFYAYIRNLLDLNKGFKENRSTGDEYIKGGYVQSFHEYHPERTLKSEFEYKIAPNQLKAFKNIINELEKRSIPFFMIQAPIPVGKYKLINNIDFIDSTFSSLGKYKNFNKLLSLPDSCFIDESHLNQKGVDSFNKLVIQEIKNGGF